MAINHARSGFLPQAQIQIASNVFQIFLFYFINNDITFATSMNNYYKFIINMIFVISHFSNPGEIENLKK